MRKCLIILLILSALGVRAQFTQRVTPPVGGTVKDSSSMSVKADAKTDLNFTLYSDAYDKYVRRELFKQRNKIKIESSLTISQTSFDNWAKGGDNFFSGRAKAYVEHVYTKDRFNIKTSLDAAYTLNMTNEYIRKAEDYLNITSTPNWRISPRWELSSSAQLKTQLANSFKAPGDTILVSSFLAPGTWNLSAGITYTQPKSSLKVYFAPISGSLLMVINKELADKGGFGMDKGRQYKPQLGMLGRITYDKRFWKDKLQYVTKLESFWDYSFLRPNLWWENTINMKFTNVFGLKFYILIIYDDKIRTPRVDEGNFWQINESFGLSLTFNYNSKNHKGPALTKITKARSKKSYW